MARPKVAVIGAGWAGATAARCLVDVGFHVEVFEREAVVGGHSRAEVLNGVVYEPNGAHIFHTSNPRVATFVNKHGLTRPYEHRVLTEVFLHDDDEVAHLLSWPLQVEELQSLPIWPQIRHELEQLPCQPAGDDFESWVISLMGPTLYRLFIRDYTRKQWGRDPSDLSSKFAPRRVELRRDSDRRLFRDRWEFFHPRGVNEVIERVLQPVSVTCGAMVTAKHLDSIGQEFEALVMTGPLDLFLGREGELAWRGVSMRSTFTPLDSEEETLTPAYVVNRPSPRVSYTRTVETKHATGQRVLGTVVSEEYPGADARHYPVHTVDGRYERMNEELKAEIEEQSPLPVFFCGRLANYQYINQDQAIEQGMATADQVIECLS